MNLEKFADRNRKFIAKMQSWPESKKKIVLWTIVGVLAIIMIFFWINGVVKSFSKISQNINIEMPKIDTSNMPSVPSLDIQQTTTPTNK